MTTLSAMLLVAFLAQVDGSVDPQTGTAQEAEPLQVVQTEPLDVGEAFVRANGSYEAGSYETAIGLYQDVLEAGRTTGPVFYNLGNAYLRNGELGRAIASYLRAQARTPRDQDLEANLDFARQSARDALLPPGPSPVRQTLFFWHYGLSRGELLEAAVVLNILLWTVAALRLRRRRSETLRWIFGTVLLLLLAVGGSLAVHWLRPVRVAVVVPQEVSAHSGTREDTVVRFKLHAGSELRMVEERDGWVRISLPDGQQGWVNADHLELVTF